MTDTSIRVTYEQRRRLKVYAAERDISQGDALERLLDQQEALQELVQQWKEYGSPADEACADELQDVLEREP